MSAHDPKITAQTQAAIAKALEVFDYFRPEPAPTPRVRELTALEQMYAYYDA